jgi:hypothetical protein
MRRLTLALLAAALLCAAMPTWAADAPAPSAPTPAIAHPAAPAMSELTPMDLVINAPQAAAISPLCPPEPVETCGECFYFGQWLTYRCTLYCFNGSPRRTCTPCGFDCPA